MNETSNFEEITASHYWGIWEFFSRFKNLKILCHIQNSEREFEGKNKANIFPETIPSIKGCRMMGGKYRYRYLGKNHPHPENKIQKSQKKMNPRKAGREG